MITIGMEFEWVAPQMHSHRSAGHRVTCEGYGCMPDATTRLRNKLRRMHPMWQAVKDGSVGWREGAELRTAWGAFTDWRDYLFPQLDSLLQRLNAEGWYASHFAGWHIHLGTPGGWNGHYDVLERLINYVEPWVGAEAPWRERDGYCRPWNGDDRREVYAWLHGERSWMPALGRYRAINLHSLQIHGTLEIRAFNSTLDRDLVWQRLLELSALCDAAERAPQRQLEMNY